MVTSILLDQSNTAFKMGTGIATYAANLAAAARLAGHGVDVLVSADAKPDPANPILSEVQLFDAKPDPLLPWLQPALDAVRGAVRAPFGYRPILLPQAQVVMRQAGQVAIFDRTYVGARIFGAAQTYFFLHGKFATVRLPAAPSVFHATHPLPVRVAGCPNIVTIHDLVPLRLPYMTLDNKRHFYRLVQRHLADAAHIVTVSEYSRRDIIALFGVPEDRVTNTYQAVSLPPRVVARTDADIADQVSHQFGLDPGNYYLFVGALEPKKNVGRLIDAYLASGTRRPLVIAGGEGWQNKTELKRIEDRRFLNYRIADNTIAEFKQIRRIPYLPRDQVVTLMRGARALLFPSVFEGFGLPVLEAMTLGTPVMTSNTTSLPEVAGGAALLVDPYDVGDMAAAIRRLDNDTDLLAELARLGREQARAFTMDAYRARLQGVYAQVLGGGKTVRA